MAPPGERRGEARGDAALGRSELHRNLHTRRLGNPLTATGAQGGGATHTTLCSHPTTSRCQTPPPRALEPDGTVLATRRDPRCSPASASSVPSPWEGNSDPHGAREHAGAGRRARCRQCGLTVHVCRPKGSRRWVTTGTSRGSFHTNSRGAASLNPAMECFTEHTCGTSEH